uniref:SPOUT domain containing methyltransferase 1 n=1 Tax=Cyprinus carpio TaxID=7962 RepID=A0A8C2FVQ4_CYPCA
MAAEPPAKKNKPNKLSNKAGEERINWRIWKEQKKEEKRRCKESKLIQQLEKQKRKEENKQQVQQEEKESKGLLNPLDSPHHMRIDEEAEFRQGVVLDQPSKPGKGSFVNCGMRKVCVCLFQRGRCIKVLLWLLTSRGQRLGCTGATASVWLPVSVSAVFTECPYKDGYDLTVGTSERGNSADHITLPPFKHMLVVFGGLQGLEASVDADENLNVADPGVLFDLYLNTCPGQGSRTIRTEQAILISLSGLRQKISAVFPDQPKG